MFRCRSERIISDEMSNGSRRSEQPSKESTRSRKHTRSLNVVYLEYLGVDSIDGSTIG